jgi:hypothetical protein
VRIRNHRYQVLRSRLAERDARLCFRFLFPKIQNLPADRFSIFSQQKIGWRRVRGSSRITQASVLGALLPSLLWGESITTPFGFLGAIAVQSTVHQFRMLLAKTAPIVRARLEGVPNAWRTRRRVMLAALTPQPHLLAVARRASVVVQFRERKLIVRPHFAGCKSLL